MSELTTFHIEKDIPSKIRTSTFFDEWYKIVEIILQNEEFQRRKLFYHHRSYSVWDYSIAVSFKSFIVAKKMSANTKITAIAGLLHDFFPYTWRYNKELEKIDNGKYLARVNRHESLFKKHGFTHAKEASQNYLTYFPSLRNDIITNSIARHMFPLNIIPPRYKEGLIITFVDKYECLLELVKTKN